MVIEYDCVEPLSVLEGPSRVSHKADKPSSAAFSFLCSNILPVNWLEVTALRYPLICPCNKK